VPIFLSITVAPDTTAPILSVTVPVMSPVVFCALDNFPSNKHGTIKNEPIVLDDIVREHSRKQLRPFILTSDDLRAPESRVVVLVCYEPASATDERCEPVIYYPNPQSLVITESEWSYSKESLQSDWHISRSCHYAAVECEGAAVVDHVAVEMRGKFKAKRASEPLSQSILSEDPLWVPAEAVLACIEVKSKLTKAELVKTFEGAKLLAKLRPFGRGFILEDVGLEDKSLTPSGKQRKKLVRSRCFRTLFAYESDLAKQDWLLKEWEGVQVAANDCSCMPTSIDRILVIGRGLITPAARAGTEDSAFSSVFHQWWIHLANFLERENSRRPPLDWQKYTKKKIPGWVNLPSAASKDNGKTHTSMNRS
jgi:hypothetical protein